VLPVPERSKKEKTFVLEDGGGKIPKKNAVYIKLKSLNRNQ